MLKVSPLIFVIVLTNYCTNQSRARESGLKEDLKFNKSDLGDLNNDEVENRSHYHQPILEKDNEISLDIPIENYDNEIENYEDYSNFDGRERFEVKDKRERWRRLEGGNGIKKKDKWRKRKTRLDDVGSQKKKTKWKGKGGGPSLKTKAKMKLKGFGGQRKREKGFWNNVVNKVNRKGGKNKRVTGGEKTHGGAVSKLEEGWKNWRDQRKMTKAVSGRRNWNTDPPANTNFDVLKLDEFLKSVSVDSTSNGVSAGDGHQETKKGKLNTIESIINGYGKVPPLRQNKTTLKINWEKLPDLWDADLPKTDLIQEGNQSVTIAKEGSVMGVYPIYKKGVVLIDKGSSADSYQLKSNESVKPKTNINDSFLKSSLGNISSPLGIAPVQRIPVDSIGETYRPMTGIQTPMTLGSCQTGDEAIPGVMYPFSTPDNMDRQVSNYRDNRFDLNEYVTSGFLNETLMPKLNAQKPLQPYDNNININGKSHHTFLDSYPAQCNKTPSSHPIQKSSTESLKVIWKQETSSVNCSNWKTDEEELTVQQKLHQSQKVVHYRTTKPVIKEDANEAVIYPTLEPKLEIAREKGVPVISLFDFNTEYNSSLYPRNDLIEIVSENKMGTNSHWEPEISTIQFEEKKTVNTESADSLAGTNEHVQFSMGNKTSVLGVSNNREMKFNKDEEDKTWSIGNAIPSNNKIEQILFSKSRNKNTNHNYMKDEEKVKQINLIEARKTFKSNEMNIVNGEKSKKKEKYLTKIEIDKEEETSLYDEDILSNFEVKSVDKSRRLPKITNLRMKLEKKNKAKLSPLDYDVEIFSLENLAHSKSPKIERKNCFNKVSIKDAIKSMNLKGRKIGARNQVSKKDREVFLDSEGEGGKRRSKDESSELEVVAKGQIKSNRKSTEIKEESSLTDNDKDVRKGEFEGWRGSELEEGCRSKSKYKNPRKEETESRPDAEVALNFHRCQKTSCDNRLKNENIENEEDDADDEDEDEEYDGEINSKEERNVELGEGKLKGKVDRRNEGHENLEPNELGADENYDDEEEYGDDSFEESERRASKIGQREDYKNGDRSDSKVNGGYYQCSEDEGKDIWQKTLQDSEGKNRKGVDEMRTDSSGTMVKVMFHSLPHNGSQENHRSKPRFKSKETNKEDICADKLSRAGPFVSYPEQGGDRYLKKIIYPGCYYLVVNGDKVGGNVNTSKYRISESEIPIVGSTPCKNHLWGTRKNKPSQLILLVSKSKEDENENITTELNNSVNDSMSLPASETPLKLCLCLGICLGTMSVPQMTSTSCSWNKTRDIVTTTIRHLESSKFAKSHQKISTINPRLNGGKDN